MNLQFGLQNSQEVSGQQMIHNDSLHWIFACFSGWIRAGCVIDSSFCCSRTMLIGSKQLCFQPAKLPQTGKQANEGGNHVAGRMGQGDTGKAKKICHQIQQGDQDSSLAQDGGYGCQ